MKHTVILWIAMVSFLTNAADPRGPLWQGVEDAVKQGLPRTALERLEPIIEGAVRDQAWAEATKAIGRRIALEAQLEGDTPGTAIRRLSRQIDQVPPTLQPVFHTLLANAYWGHFRQNQWRFAQRTATATPPGDDFDTWDLRTLFARIDLHFRTALAQDTLLKSIPIADFDPLLDKGNLPDSLRPTLYEFLAHQALDFYQAGEQGLARPEDAFVAAADGPILGAQETFLRWRPNVGAADAESPTLRAILLFQELLRHHATLPDPAPLIATDIERLAFAHRVASGPDKDTRYLDALLDLANRWPTHELSARARQAAARVQQSLGKLIEAHRLAREANQAFPNSFWTRDSRNLIAEIEAPSVAISTERAWTEPWPAIDVDYRNGSRIWFRAVPADWAQFLDRRLPRPERLNRRQRLEWLARPATLEWSVDLPATPDYRTRRHSVPAPTTLPSGYYFIFASHAPGFPEADNDLAVTTVWVSPLALLTIAADKAIEGFVVDAQTGEPKPGATVEAWFLSQGGNRSPVPPQTTDALGFFRIPQPQRDRGHLLRATLGTNQIALASDIWWHPSASHQESTPRDQSIILTDRAIYRPGQPVRFKGISFHLDDARVRYQLRPNLDLTVVFRDANGQEIARRNLRTSYLGSFSGSFDTPRSGLTGRMSIQVEGSLGETAWIQVEEYKRPRFQVVLDPPRESPRLNDTVTASGRAVAYTGNPLQNARVEWRVTRQTRFPIHWGFLRPGPFPGVETAQNIAHGTAQTDAEGAFTFRFRALADPMALEADEPIFDFQIEVDLTDSTGESRSQTRSLSIGYAALAASLHPSSWIESGKPTPIRIETRSLDGDPLPANGTLRIHRLEEPSFVHRPPLQPDHFPFPRFPGQTTAIPATPPVDLSNPAHWRLAGQVLEQPFRTQAQGVVTNELSLPPGAYRASLETTDRFGRKVSAQVALTVVDPQAASLNIRIPYLVNARAWEVEPGQEFLGLWGTGYESGRAFIEIRHRDSVLQRFWTEPGRTQQAFSVPITETLRGGFTVSILQVRENRLHRTQRHVEVPWKHKQLEVRWESFRSRLEPGRQETWTATLHPARPQTADREATLRAATEMAATLYDASLDQFLQHSWPDGFDFWPRFPTSHPIFHFSNDAASFDTFVARERPRPEDATVRFREFPAELRFENLGIRPRFRTFTGTMSATAAPALLMDAEAVGDIAERVQPGFAAKGANFDADDEASAAAGGATPAATPPPASVIPRRNLAETAFFFPHVTADSNGTFRIAFTAPEALTEWRFLGFAHDPDLRSGLLQGRSVTAKDLMVQPNPPRFLREGDSLEFPVKLINASEQPQSGRIRLSFAFAFDGQSADASLGNQTVEQTFQLAPRESRTFTWPIRVPDGCGFLTFKATAAAANHTDGEEGALPVLARRIRVTESLPLTLRGPGSREFEFASLRRSVESPSLRHQGLQVQMTSQPAWYAVLALPYLMEFPHECSEQVFNRLYANALARHVATSNPRIRQIFDQWRATPALDSPLEKNPDLKAAALSETPWVRDARSESESRRNIGVLFDAQRLDEETSRALNKLEEMLLPDGTWPWFPNGPRNEFISLYIVGGFGRLRELGIQLPGDRDLASRAIPQLDAWMTERHRDLTEKKLLDRRNIDPSIALYLYSRSFHAAAIPWPEDSLPARDYWLAQAREHWLTLDRQSQAHIALAFHRLGNAIHHDAQGAARAITRSLLERSVLSDEMGRFWNDEGPRWWWHRAPIETQALMIEAFLKIDGNQAAADECRTWLLQQKRTQHWPSTKATADAVHALLLGGPSLLDATALVEVELGGHNITPDPRAPARDGQPAPEPGTGFYQVRIPATDIGPNLARVLVRKSDPGIAWGAVHWQYFEDLSRIQPFAGTPLTLSKRLFIRFNTPQGPRLDPVNGPVRVGDELVVRLELRVDRDVEFVHLKDLRASGTEPVNVLSGHRFQDGLAYYESTRDTASHFFFDHVRRGSYVLEYPLRVQHRGSFPAGVAEVQCLYAPEFNSHSESLHITAR